MWNKQQKHRHRQLVQVSLLPGYGSVYFFITSWNTGNTTEVASLSPMYVWLHDILSTCVAIIVDLLKSNKNVSSHGSPGCQPVYIAWILPNY